MAPSQITRPGCPGRPAVSIILEAWSKQPLTANCRGQGRACPAKLWGTPSKLINCRFLQHFSKHLNLSNCYKLVVTPCKRVQVQWRLWWECTCWAVHAASCCTVQPVISISSHPHPGTNQWILYHHQCYHSSSSTIYLEISVKASFSSSNICKLVRMLSGACWAVTGEDVGWGCTICTFCTLLRL